MMTEEQKKQILSSPEWKNFVDSRKKTVSDAEKTQEVGDIEERIKARRQRLGISETGEKIEGIDLEAKQAKMEAEVQAKEQAISDQKAQDPMRQGVIGKTLGAGFDVLKGAAKGVASTVVGMGELGTKLNPFISKEDKQNTSNFAQGLRENQLKARGTAEQTGKTIEQIAEFFIPASASLKAGQAASAVVKGGKLLKGVTKLGAIGATEGVLGTGQSAMQSGKLGADELKAGAVSLVAPAALAGAGKAFKAITPQPVRNLINEAVDKALRPSKKSITDPKFYDKADDAFHILARNKTLTDETGALRNPETRSETLDVLKNAKKKIYEEYSSLANVATGKGAQINTQPIIADTINLVKDKGWSSDVKEYAIKQARSLSDLEGASPAKIQDRIEELNNNFNPFATGKDKVRTEIDASIARRLRQTLDEAIEKTEGEGYQALRNEYASLKTIENDLINASAVEARRNKAGLVDFTDIFTGGNILGSVVTGNPAMFVQGLGGRGVKEFIKWMNDPNRYLKNAFNAIEKNPNFRKQMGGATQRALAEGVTQTPTVQVPINLPAKAQSTIDKEELDLAIKSMDKRQLFEALNKLDEQDLRLMLTEGTGGFQGTPINLPAKSASSIEAEQVRRLGGVDKGFSSPAVGKTADDTLIQEAKKYKSAEEFVKAQGTPVYHGTDKTVSELKLEKPMSRMYNPEKYKAIGLDIQPSISLSDNGFIAKKFSLKANKEVKEIFVSPKKILDLTKKSVDAEKYKSINNVIRDKYLNPDFYTTSDAHKFLKENGYDAIRIKAKNELGGGMDTELRIFDESIVKTKSQLTDIWNKANKK